MDHPQRVGIAEGRADLVDKTLDADSRPLAEQPAPWIAVDQEGAIGLSPIVDERSDVLMVEKRQALGVGLEVADEVDIGGIAAFDDLDKNLAADRRLECPVQRP